MILLKDRADAPRQSVSAVCPAAELFIPLGELVDLIQERKRLFKEHENTLKEIARATGKLQNPGFLSKAPEHLIAEERKKLETLQTIREALRAQQEALEAE